MRSYLFVITDTKIHKEFCMLEARCFTIRTAVLNMMVDLTGKTHKWDFAIDIANDGAPVFKSAFVMVEASMLSDLLLLSRFKDSHSGHHTR